MLVVDDELVDNGLVDFLARELVAVSLVDNTRQIGEVFRNVRRALLQNEVVLVPHLLQELLITLNIL